MGAAEQLPTPLTETLTWTELQARFPYQYVALLMEDDDDDFVSGKSAIRGRVVSYGRTPMDVVEGSKPWRGLDVRFGLFYTGVGMADEDRDAVPAHL